MLLMACGAGPRATVSSLSSFVCTVQGPHSISMRYHITTPLEAGMIVSNEPGYYEDGGFGVRVENLVYIKEVDTPFRWGAWLS